MAKARGNGQPPEGKKFTSEYQPENKGRKPSIKREIQKLLSGDGSFRIPLDQVTEFNEAEGFISIKIPRQEALAMRYLQFAMSNSPEHAMRAIEKLMDHLDGRAKQSLTIDSWGDVEATTVPLSDWSDDQVREELKRLKSNNNDSGDSAGK